FERAIDCYQKVIEIDDINEYAHLGLGLSYYSLEKYESAIFYLEKLIKLDPQHGDAYYYLGLSHQRSQNLVLADEALSRALAISPLNSSFLHAKAELMYNLKNYPAAIETYQALVKIEPQNATGWYDLACCYALQDRLDSALDNLRKAIELEPDKLKNSARTDADFALLHDNELFKNLVT
ncbi:tetratricopeptide repeat protein, partial [Chamaesiphon sp. OTE_20_metabat_361]|uniref:tetratricopeptide repeat protein n=1 Tax=Chamaesiphon sp. OTE_20_metabat_361 TaxID=2964689 RepID=UPI00286A355D